MYDGIPVYRFTYFWPSGLQKLAYGDGIPTNIRRSFLAKMQLPVFILFFFLKSLRHSSNVDVIHSHWTIAGLVGVFVSKLTRKKHVLSMHGAEIFVLGKNRVLGFVLKRVDLLINNSRFTQANVLENYPHTNCVVISPGTDTARFYPQFKQGLRTELGLGDLDIFILCVGKFIPRKGIEYLIDAMDILVHKRGLENLKLRIGGRGYLKPVYEKKISNLHLERSIEFTGYIPDGEIPYYYSESDIFVLPSIVDENGDTEGLGVVLVEANACGTAVISSRVGGIPDVIEDGYNGLLIEQKQPLQLAEAIQTLCENDSLRKEIGQRGMEKVKKEFSWHEIAKKIERHYYELFGSE